MLLRNTIWKKAEERKKKRAKTPCDLIYNSCSDSGDKEPGRVLAGLISTSRNGRSSPAVTELLSPLRLEKKKKKSSLHYSPPTAVLGSGETTGGKTNKKKQQKTNNNNKKQNPKGTKKQKKNSVAKLFLSLLVVQTDAKPAFFSFLFFLSFLGF